MKILFAAATLISSLANANSAVITCTLSDNYGTPLETKSQIFDGSPLTIKLDKLAPQISYASLSSVAGIITFNGVILNQVSTVSNSVNVFQTFTGEFKSASIQNSEYKLGCVASL